MSMYYPNGFAILRIEGLGYKLFSSFWGGYAGGDSWRMNSGITKVIKKNNIYNVFGHSGSHYMVNCFTEGQLGSYNQAMLDSFIGQLPSMRVVTLEEMIADPNFGEYPVEYSEET